jgi:hypothetical protein
LDWKAREFKILQTKTTAKTITKKVVENVKKEDKLLKNPFYKSLSDRDKKLV